MAATSSSLKVSFPKTGIVPGPTRIASATSVRLDDVTGGTKDSGAPASAPLGVADSVPPMPVEEWQAAQLARYSSAPWASPAGGLPATTGTSGPAPVSVRR